MDEDRSWSVYEDREAYLKVRAMKFAVHLESINPDKPVTALEVAKEIFDWLKGEANGLTGE